MRVAIAASCRAWATFLARGLGVSLPAVRCGGCAAAAAAGAPAGGRGGALLLLALTAVGRVNAPPCHIWLAASASSP